MSAPPLSTETPRPNYGPLMRRSLGRALLYSSAIVTVILALAFVPALIHDPQGLGRAILRAGAPHAPDLGPVLRASPAIKIHLATVLTALGATFVLMAGVKGSAWHRGLGWTWTVAMVGAAASAFFIRGVVGPTVMGFGFLHLFAVITLISAPRAVAAARRHDVVSHARIICGFVVGGLGIAGLAAFLPGRIVWQVFFG